MSNAPRSRRFSRWLPRLKAIGPALLCVVGLSMMVPAFIDYYGESREGSNEGFSPFRPSGSEATSVTNGRDVDSFHSASDPSSRSAFGLDWESQPARDVTSASDRPAFDCMLLPSEQVSVRSPVTGRIDAIHVERADSVHMGELLVELDADLAQSELDLAKKRSTMTAGMHSLEARKALSLDRRDRAETLYANRAMALDRQQELDTEHEIARYDLEEARDQHELSSLEYARASAVYARRQIRSPFEGVIVSRLMSVGEVVDEETVLEIARIDPLRVEVVLPAERFGSIKTGMKATIAPEITTDDVRIATVKIVDRTIDSASGTFGVALELPNPGYAIPSGLRCEVRFLEMPSTETQVSANEAIVVGEITP